MLMTVGLVCLIAGIFLGPLQFFQDAIRLLREAPVRGPNTEEPVDSGVDGS